MAGRVALIGAALAAVLVFPTAALAQQATPASGSGGLPGAAAFGVYPSGGSHSAATRTADSLTLADAMFSDPAGDAGQALDVVDVAVRDGICGIINFDIGVPNQQSLHPQDRLVVYLDTELGQGNPAQRGADYAIDVDGDGSVSGSPSIGLYRWTGTWTFESTPSLEGQYFFGEFISISRGALGDPEEFAFYIYARYTDVDDPAHEEFAPNSNIWMYQLDGLGSCGADSRDPVVNAIEADATRDPSVARLDYRVRDNSGEARWTLLVRRTDTKRVTWSRSFALQETNATGESFKWRWNIPRDVRGFRQFCVRALDAALNRSPLDCTRVRFKRIAADANPSTRRWPSNVELVDLSVEGLPVKTRVTIDCARRCDVHESATDRGTYTSRKFRDRFFQYGAVIVVRATKPRWAGYYEKITLARSGNGECVRVLPPGMRNPPRQCR